MKRFLLLLLAAGGILLATAGEAAAHRWRRHPGYYGWGPRYRGGGVAISINRGYYPGYHRGYGYPVRRSVGFYYGRGPAVYGGYYGAGYYGGGFHGGGCRY